MRDFLVKVAFHGVPRSGTSWIGEVLNSSPQTIYRFQPLFSYALKGYLTNTSSKDDIDLFFQKLVNVDDVFINQTEKRQNQGYPRFNKGSRTHIIYKEVRYMNILPNIMRKTEDVFLCGVIRNPLSVINSWLRAPREFRSDLGWSELEEWRYACKKNLNRPEEYNGYMKWKEAAYLFRELKEKYPDRVHIIKYADFLSNPVQKSKLLFNLLGLPYTESTTAFLSESSTRVNMDPYSVYRSVQSDDKWIAQLNSIITEEIRSDLMGTELEEYLST